MSQLLLTKQAAPAAPAANKVQMYVDTADRRMKQIDENGVISDFTQSGQRDRNVLHNGGFRVQQRVATAATQIPAVSTTTRAGQVADRWAVTASVATNIAWAQIDTSGAVETGLLARYYGSMIASTAGKKVMLSQVILNSDMAHMRGQRVRLSVKLNQKVGSGQTYHLGLLQLNASGTVDVMPAFQTGAWSTTTGVAPAWGTNLAAISPDASPAGENGTVNGSYLDITSLVTTWRRSSCCFTVPTTAKNLVAVLFSDATGGTTDNISVAEFQLTLGLEIVDYVECSLDEEVLRCQRFFCKSFAMTTVPVQNGGVVGCITGIAGKAGATALAGKIWVQFPVVMWKAPVVTAYCPTEVSAQVDRIDGTTPIAHTATAQLHLSDNGVFFTSTGTTNTAVGDTIAVHYSAEADFIL